jgi:hypothetical protein
MKLLYDLCSFCSIKVAASPAGIKYKGDIQLPKEINCAIEFDKNSGNLLWGEAIKTDIKKLTDHPKFLIFD